MPKRRGPSPSELERKIPALHGALTRNSPVTGPLSDIFHAMLGTLPWTEARNAEQYLDTLDLVIALRRARLIASLNPPGEDHQPELAGFDRAAQKIRQAVTDVFSTSTG